MIDPRFANAGAVPFAPGYGAQQVPVNHHRHRHHRHRKGKHGIGAASPLSRDESIHKVDHGHQHFQQNQGAQFGGGFGVPYGPAGGFGPAPSGFGPAPPGGFGPAVPGGFGPAVPGGFGPAVPGGFGPAPPGGFGAGGPGGFFQQQPFGGGNFGYGNQFQGNGFAQGQFGGGPAVIKHHRHHRRHHHDEPQGVTDQATGVPEQLIGQRSSSVIADEGQRVHSPGEAGVGGEVVTHHRRHHHEHEQRHHHHHHHHKDHHHHHRQDHHNHQDHQHQDHHHHHHHSAEHADFGHTHQSRQTHAYQNPNQPGVNGYAHINDDLIFIERGDCSPSRQTPPPGYDYKGKIEVQGADTELHTRTRCAAPCPPQPCVPCPPPPCVPCLPPPCGPVLQPQSMGICPPGWQQMIATAAPGGPCPPGASMFHGQLVGAGGIGHAGIGGSTDGFVGGPMGASGSGGGLASLAASLPVPPQGQIVADYFLDSNTSGGIGSAGESSFGTGYQLDGGAGYQQDGGAGYAEQCCQEVEEHVCTKAKIIEVWQKRSRPQLREPSPYRSRSRTPQPTFDFERFRTDILETIERMVPAPAKLQWTGHDGGTQTQLNPVEVKENIRPAPPSEVRVIVQPIQPVFYMPRQSEGPAPQIIHAPAIQQAPNVVYVPRNVYVPVIKPVFVPKERVIVRPQVIHVARPVLVDRPVPVTQRPIIIDRERPVPVPVRSAQVAQTGGSRVIREDFVYQDTLPVAYAGRCEEFTGTTSNYDYAPTQQEQQYATSSTHEVSNDYQTQGPCIDETTTAQFQHSHSASQLDAQQGGGSFHGSYSNLAHTNSASGINVAPLICTPPIDVRGLPPVSIDVLDSTVNPGWQKTDQSSLVRRYGRPAYDIVQKTDQVEQQMYHELRQRSSSGGIQRSDSAASYASGSGGGVGQIFTQEVYHQGQAPIPVRINY